MALSLFFFACSSDPCLKKDGRFGVRNECEAPVFTGDAGMRRALLLNISTLNFSEGNPSALERIDQEVKRRGSGKLGWALYGSQELTPHRAQMIFPALLDKIHPSYVVVYFDQSTLVNDYLYAKSREGWPGLRDVGYEFRKIRAFTKKRVDSNLYQELVAHYVQLFGTMRAAAKERRIPVFFLSNGATKQGFGNERVYRYFSVLSPAVNGILPAIHDDFSFLGLAASRAGLDYVVDMSLGKIEESHGSAQDVVDLLLARVVQRIKNKVK